ncbi:MAG TPA: glycoside hydrolase family 76 protein [Kofleriaceae bacterium]|nr:glycoside hydrolase family 76 protein [Kofleriaceae bacterium]
MHGGGAPALLAAALAVGCATEPDPVYRAQADGAMAALDLMYLEGVGLFGFAWWNSANALETTIDYIAETGNDDYLTIIGNSFEVNAAGRGVNPTPNFINQLYDDEAWWALTWIEAYDLTGEARYLEMAQTIFDDLAGGWDDTCGGGVWWSKDRDYKNAITNELFLTAAARLHRRTSAGGESTVYLDWADRTWAWFAASGMINGDHLVNDGLTDDCRNNGQTAWTYNQGVILGALAEMFEITGDEVYLTRAEAIADAAMRELVTPRGILSEPCEPDCDGNGAQFKGIFMRNLARLHEVAPAARYRDFIERNADSIREQATSPHHEIGLLWDAPFDAADPIRQSSGLDAVVAALRVTRD